MNFRQSSDVGCAKIKNRLLASTYWSSLCLNSKIHHTVGHSDNKIRNTLQQISYSKSRRVEVCHTTHFYSTCSQPSSLQTPSYLQPFTSSALLKPVQFTFAAPLLSLVTCSAQFATIWILCPVQLRFLHWSAQLSTCPLLHTSTLSHSTFAQYSTPTPFFCLIIIHHLSNSSPPYVCLLAHSGSWYGSPHIKKCVNNMCPEAIKCTVIVKYAISLISISVL